MKIPRSLMIDGSSEAGAVSVPFVSSSSFTFSVFSLFSSARSGCSIVPQAANARRQTDKSAKIDTFFTLSLLTTILMNSTTHTLPVFKHKEKQQFLNHLRLWKKE